VEKKVISKENVQNLVEDLPEIISITMVLIKEIMISTPEEAEEDFKDSEVEIMATLEAEIFKEKVMVEENLIIIMTTIGIMVITIIVMVEMEEETFITII
jgi:hypothetical protein